MAHTRSFKQRIYAPVIALLVAVAATSGVIALNAPDLAEQAADEGELVIYSATDEREFAELLRVFRENYPDIRVKYESLAAQEIYQRYLAEEQGGRSRADLLINSAMDLQIKLVNDGFAQSYEATQSMALPEWAVWKNQAFAISSEPIVIGYNPKLLPPSQVPRSHDDLAALLYDRPDLFSRKVGLYDPLQSPTGYLYINQDVRNDSDAWELLGAIGRTGPKLYLSSEEMLDAVSSGRLALAYNVIGSYAFERAARDPDFAVVIPRDYVLMMSRVAMISRDAPHPNAAKLFLEFLLSKTGQEILARHHMTPLRNDVRQDEHSLESANTREVRVGPALMAGLDRLTKASFARKWKLAIANVDQR